MRPLYIIIGLVALIAFLHFQFPYALQDENVRMRALYLVMVLALIAGGGRAFKNRPVSKTLRDAAIWLAILVVLVFAYSFRDEFGNSRFMAELMPSRVHVEGDGAMSIRASEGGHFMVESEVNGMPVRFMIDTGASDIVLSPDDARRAGLNPDTLKYSTFASTANGGVAGALVTLDSLKIGNITLSHIPASVNGKWMSESLLGMSFLRRLKGYRVEGNRLVLIP